MGENRFRTPEELLHQKINKIDRKPNRKMRIGTSLEPTARFLYQEKTRKNVQPICIQSHSYPWLIASLDGISKDLQHVVEIKCGVSAFWQAAKGIVPDYYYGQLQHQLMITGLDCLDYWCYLPGKRGVLIEVERDDQYIEQLFEEEERFYRLMRESV